MTTVKCSICELPLIRTGAFENGEEIIYVLPCSCVTNELKERKGLKERKEQARRDCLYQSELRDEIDAWKEFAEKSVAPLKPLLSKSTTTGAVTITIIKDIKDEDN